ncbi:unnamed protein product [Allacma fusca]|uniref:Uncharacterized protein n=1 Tax=Allacma fusca TaxID=39272 RepID=A0A8J2P1I9_9HEXA|nr:unnamed protein product [Allacma fusca]
MHPEFAVGIPEAITNIIAGLAFILALVALYKDARWATACETSAYFRPILSWIRKNSGEYEMSAFRRDIFYQVVVTVFIAPAVIHLTIHLIITILHKYPEEDYEPDDLVTPDEDPEFLNSTPNTQTDSPLHSHNNGAPEEEGTSADDKAFTRWLAQLFCLHNQKRPRNGDNPLQPRMSRSLPGRLDSSLHTLAGKLGTNSASTPNVAFLSKPGPQKSTKNILKCFDNKDPPCSSPNPNEIVGERLGETEDTPEKNINSFSHVTVAEAKFLNPRLLKLLLMAAIIFECMLAFSSSYYQYNELMRFDRYYLSSVNLTSKMNSSDAAVAAAALILTSCSPNNLIASAKLHRFPELEKERDEVHACQAFRAKAWVVVLCCLYGITGLVTTVVIYGQYRDTLGFTYGGHYPLIGKRYAQRRRGWGSADASTQEGPSDLSKMEEFIIVSPEEMQRRIRRDSFSEDEKVFSGYTVGMDMNSVVKNVGLTSMV